MYRTHGPVSSGCSTLSNEEGLSKEPNRTSTNIIHVNPTGSYFTTAPALHHFILDTKEKNFEPATKHLTLISSMWRTLQLHCKAMAIRRSRACEDGGRALGMIARSNTVLENESACTHINEDTHDQAGHRVSGGDGIRGLSDWWCDQSGYALGLLYDVSLKDPWHHYLKVRPLVSATTWRALMENANPLF